MISKRHPHTTRYLGAPKGWEPDEQGPCGHLAISDIPTTAGPAMQSLWEPTPDELAQLNAGGVVVLTIIGTEHPPIEIKTWLRKEPN